MHLKNNSFLIFLAILTLLSPLVVFGGTIPKFITLSISLYLVFKKDILFFPLIILGCCFLSTSYIIYIAMFIVVLINYNYFKTIKMSGFLLVFVFAIILMFVFSFIKYFAIGTNIGLSITDYSFVLALSPFFYGILLMKNTCEVRYNNIFLVLILIVILNSIFKIVNSEFVSTRLVFYTIPLLFLYILSSLVLKGSYIRMFGSFFILLFVLSGITFTLLFSAIITFIISLNFLKNYRYLTLFTLLIFSIILTIYATKYTNEIDYSNYLDKQMSDIQNTGDFVGRLSMKLFDDRATIWQAAWEDIVSRKALLPPLIKIPLSIKHVDNIDLDWEFHTHNIYIESLRSLGIILGLVVSLIFVRILLKTAKNMGNIYAHNTELATLVLLSIVTSIIGAMTGVYPLLLDYSVLTLGLCGISYGHKLLNFKR